MRFIVNVRDDGDPEVVQAQVAYHLEGVARTNRWLMLTHRVPLLYRSGVRYAIEDSAGESQTMADCLEALERRTTECMGASCWRLAEHRNAAGSEERAAQYGLHVYPKDYIVEGQHVRLFHVQVRHPDGSIEDPSVKIGMHA
jgi:hypothetical protein